MLAHTSHDIAVTLADAQTPPVFVPLCDLYPGTMILESQCALGWEGVPVPVEMRVVVAPTGTPLGPPVTPLVEGAAFTPPAGTLPLGLSAGLPDLRPHTGVLGITVAPGGTQPTTLPAGAKLVGRVALVQSVI